MREQTTERTGVRWHEITRNFQQLTPDQQRARENAVPPLLDGMIILFVKHGDQPVREYIHGDTGRLTKAGKLAGFDPKPMDDKEEPELPEHVIAAAHPLVPWSARLNKLSNMERLRTDSMDETRKGIETVMSPDSYVSVTLRRYGTIERNRIRNWVAGEYNNPEDEEPLVRSGAMCARASCGATSMGEAREIAEAVGRSLSGSLDKMSSHPSRPRLGLFIASLIAAIVWTVTVALSPWSLWALLLPLAVLIIAGVWSMIVGHVARGSVGEQALAATILALIVAGVGMLPLPLWTMIFPWPIVVFALVRWLRASLWDDIEQKPRRYLWWAQTRKATSADNEKEGAEEERKAVVPAYGTQRSTMLLTPSAVVALCTPVGEAQAVAQESHPVPNELAEGGVLIGKDQNGRTGYLDPSQLYGGVAIIGEAGSGKSVLTHGLMQWADLNRTHTDAKVWGRDSLVISFEMKDAKGVDTMNRFRAKHHLPQGMVSYIADPKYACIDLLGVMDRKDASAVGYGIARAMQYSFEQGAIMNDSLSKLTSAFTIGVAVSRYEQKLTRHEEKTGESNPLNHVAARVKSLEHMYPGATQAKDQQSAVGWACMALCASDGQAGSAMALGHVVRGLAAQYPNNNDLNLAKTAAEMLYGRPDKKGQFTLRERDILSKVGPASTKVTQLMQCEQVFLPSRARVSWETVLEGPAHDYHFVFSPHRDEHGVLHRLPEGMDRILGAWLMYRLWNAVDATCQDWKDAGKHTMLVCDELSMLANADSLILSKVREQGRSFGLIPVFATQFPQQLDAELLDSFMGYATFITFNTPNPEVARIAAARLTDNDGEDGWTAGAVTNLPKYTCAVRTRTPRQMQPAFLLAAHDFDGHPL